MSVDLQADLENVSSFISVANYPNPMNALEAEWGSTRNVRWLLNTNGFSGGTSVGGTTGPIYSSFILGQEAKMLGLYKSSLIDLETLQGDKGQAEAEMLLAA